MYSVNIVQIWSYFWSLFSCISTEYGYLLEIYTVNLRIQSEYRKMQTRNNSVIGQFSRSVVYGNMGALGDGQS